MKAGRGTGCGFVLGFAFPFFERGRAGLETTDFGAEKESSFRGRVRRLPILLL